MHTNWHAALPLVHATVSGKLVKLCITDVHAGVQEVLECHGWAEAALAEGHSQLPRIEMFLSAFDTTSCLHFFSNVITLQILCQDVATLDALSCCTQLQHLWIVEAGLTSMRGLEHFPKLSHLYLYNNDLTQIAHLGSCTNLQVLWLGGNQISSLSGLHSMGELQELQLAENPFSHIGDALDDLVKLQVRHNYHILPACAAALQVACALRLRCYHPVRYLVAVLSISAPHRLAML